MDSPLISVLTPFKNTSLYLEECLDSILAQTHNNWELLAVDDHSSDGSYELVESYANKDSRIKVIRNTGNGIIEGLRLAFASSSGSLITRMDSDDVMDKSKLSILRDLLEKEGLGYVAIGKVKYFSKTGVKDGFDRYEKWLNKLTEKGANYSEIYKECVVPSPNFMVHKDDLLKCGDFQSDIYPEDYDLTFRFYKHGLKCIPCNTLTHYWRDHSTRASRTDDHYSSNYLLDIKIRYFLELDYDPNRTLAVWGAGTKGKTVAKYLVKEGVPFYWICDNPKKIGHHIYNQELLNFDYLSKLENPQSIVTVANEQAQVEIRAYMDKQEMHSMKDYFFFC